MTFFSIKKNGATVCTLWTKLRHTYTPIYMASYLRWTAHQHMRTIIFTRPTLSSALLGPWINKQKLKLNTIVRKMWPLFIKRFLEARCSLHLTINSVYQVIKHRQHNSYLQWTAIRLPFITQYFPLPSCKRFTNLKICHQVLFKVIQ